MTELFPVLAGALVGAAAGSLRPAAPTRLIVPMVLLLGLAATALSGEWRITWAFLLVDIPLVAGAALATFLASRRLRLRHA